MVCRRCTRSSRQQSRASGEGIASAVIVSKAKTTHKKTIENPRYTRKTPVKSQQSVNQFILSFACSVLDFGNLAVVLFNRGKQLSLNSLLSNHPNRQLSYIHKIVGTRKTIVHALHTANQVILRKRPTLPYHIRPPLNKQLFLDYN